jgi:hypothetical protein
MNFASELLFEKFKRKSAPQVVAASDGFGRARIDVESLPHDLAGRVDGADV